MKKILLTLFAAMLIASCSTTKKVAYFQDMRNGGTIEVAIPAEIKLKPGDKISIHVNSKDEELVAPFNFHRNQNTSSGTETRLAYTIDNDGYIDVPTLGPVLAKDRTRDELAKHLKQEIINNGYILDPVVLVDYFDLQISVLGEVNKPGKVNIDKDRFTIIDALSQAGDLTITGKRDNIMVLREEDGKQKAYTVNINEASQLMSSPVYYLQQNDIVYVEPNTKKAGQSTINDNTMRSTSFWMSLTSFIMTVVTFLTR
ncbi:MAG: polysaccharide biosynthesis/export family protein [Bacteroidaceae bacterium]|nr:polysaccharide biosynthesis/export family protein [Bacteroidaceae bacterium]